MAMRLGRVMAEMLTELRYEPTAKRVRASVGDRTVVDTTRAILVWEPQRAVPTYAVPDGDLRCDLIAASPPQTVATGAARPKLGPGGYGAFTLHTSDGEPLGLRIDGTERAAIAFRSADPDLAGYVLLDFDAFTWLEEDEVIRGHPRDPYHRVDVRRSSRHVRIELAGELLAESSRPRIVFETKLPPRFYLPREDVRTGVLQPSTKRSICAYKGDATYFSAALGERTVRDLAWSYEQPLPDAIEIAGLVSFYDERVDVVLDGVRRERPQTPWSK